jgi:hypothetical protein
VPVKIRIRPYGAGFGQNDCLPVFWVKYPFTQAGKGILFIGKIPFNFSQVMKKGLKGF